MVLDPSPLRWAAAVMRDWGHVGDGGDLEAGRLERADRLLAAAARTLHEDLDLSHPMVHGASGGEVGGLGRGVRGTLPRALEAGQAGTAPADDVPARIGDGDEGVVERRLDVRVPDRHVLALSLLSALRLLSLCHVTPGALLLAADANGALRTAALPRVGLRSLAPGRQVAPMAHAAVRADLHEALDVHAHLAAPVALDLRAAVDHLAQPIDLVLGQVAHPRVGGDAGRAHRSRGRGGADAVDVGERHHHPLLAGNVDAGDTSHGGTNPAAACAWG